jgi:hypothetical protein
LPQWPHTPEFAAAGGLISYGNSLADAYRLEGNYAGRDVMISEQVLLESARYSLEQ